MVLKIKSFEKKVNDLMKSHDFICKPINRFGFIECNDTIFTENTFMVKEKGFEIFQGKGEDKKSVAKVHVTNTLQLVTMLKAVLTFKRN